MEAVVVVTEVAAMDMEAVVVVTGEVDTEVMKKFKYNFRME